MINYEDFKKVDMRVGEIKHAEHIPDTDKLLRLEVDFGDEKRQIVSGIAEYYAPDELVGKQAVFAVNLEPRTIRGVESAGMIVAAGGERITLLVPETRVEPGTGIG